MARIPPFVLFNNIPPNARIAESPIVDDDITEDLAFELPEFELDETKPKTKLGAATKRRQTTGVCYVCDGPLIIEDLVCLECREDIDDGTK